MVGFATPVSGLTQAALAQERGRLAEQPIEGEARDSRVPTLSGEQLAVAVLNLKRGDQQAANGDFAAARLFYKRAADLGYAPAALALARSYDPVELRRRGAIGLTGDQAMANRWYERARDLEAR